MNRATFTVAVDVSGLGHYDAAAHEAVRLALQDEAQAIATDAAGRAPVLTGALRDSITATQKMPIRGVSTTG